MVFVPLIGLGFGALLAVSGLALWDALRHAQGLSRAIWTIRWIAGGLLLASVPLLWNARQLTLPLQLALMAAITAPPTGRQRPPWHNVMAVLPALALAGTGFLLVTGPAQAKEQITLPAILAAALCNGLAARVLGEALGTLVSPSALTSRLFDALYLLLTLLVGTNALTALWQQGVVWEGNAAEGGMVGAWLAWSAAWLSPRERPRLRAGLIVIAALVLIALAFKTS